MKDFLKKAWKVAIYSSVNRDKISFTLKSSTVILIPIIAKYMGIDTIVVDARIQELVDVVNAVLIIVGFAGTLWGFMRKLVLTSVGEHDALK